MHVYLKFIRLFLVLMVVFTGCGSSGGGKKDTNNISPDIVNIVGLTSIDSDKITLEWIEANDDTTSKQNMKYEIHTSKNKDFTPSSLTLDKSVQGIDFTTIDGLEANTEYYIKIVAIDKDNLKSISFENKIKTSSIKVEVSPETKYIKSTSQVLVDSIIVDKNSTVKSNDIIVSEENGGFARRVTKVVDKNGKRTLETKAVSLAEIYQDMSVHTSIELVDLEQSKAQKLSKSYQKTLQKNGFQLSKKWGSGLTIFDTKSNQINKYNKTNKYNKAEIKMESHEEESFNLTIPAYYAFNVEDKESQKISLKFLRKKEPELLNEDFWYDICSVKSKIIFSDGSFYNGRVKKEQDTIFSVDYSHNSTLKDHVSGDKYDLEFQITTAKEGTCRDKKPIYKETYSINSKIWIGSGSLALSGEISEMIPFSGYKGKNLNITSQLTGTFKPKLIIDSFIKDGELAKGKVEVVVDINLKNEIKAVLEASKGFEYQKRFINKKFIKVIPAGYVPLVFNGSFEVALVIEGKATGKIDITNTLINDYELHAGFQYNKDTKKWKYIGTSENKFEIKLKGEAGAEVILKVSLQPKLTLKLYDSVGGGVALDPYVKAEASGRIVKSISKNIENSTMTGIHTQFINDSFISVDKVDGSLGLDLRWYVMAKVFDIELASYPDGVDENKASTYKQVTVIKPQLFASLPKLSIKHEKYLNEIGKDSRLMIIEGEAKPVKSVLKDAFNLGSKYIINHRKWSFTELIRPRQEMLNSIDDTKSLLLVDTVGIDYQIRMLEESTLGLPHAVETTFKIEDQNYNNLPDSWEKAYGIYESGSTESSGSKDEDKDGLTNAEEYQYGTHPDKVDSDGDGCTDKEEIDANTKPLDKYNRPKQCENDESEPSRLIVSLDLGDDLDILEEKIKVIPFTISDKDNQINKVECLATPNGITLSNTNKKVIMTAPSYSELKEFTVKCIARDDKLKVLDSDEIKVTVTKKPVVEPTNTPPTVSLPASLGVENKIVPIESDDKGIVKHSWSIVWNGDKKSEASPLSASTDTLTLHVPTLEAGESLSATVTLIVEDVEGESATATQTYNYSVEKIEAIKFISDNFDDGTVLPRGTTNHLEWKIKNVSNVDLKDVVLTVGKTADMLTVSEMIPSTIATWAKGETKTFSVDVTVPNDITEGTHKQLWNFYYNTNQALPYEGKTASAPIFFEFKTTKPNELIGRLITDKKLVTPNETITSLLEITSGNPSYTTDISWGDGVSEGELDIAQNTSTGMTKSLTHSYSSEGVYHITVKVTDNAKKEAIFTDTITVESSTTKTSWTADVHDINTDERASNIAITVNTVDGHGQYHTNWTPTKDTESKEYFVKYRLPIPSKLLMLDKKMRVTVGGLSSDIEAYDREINFKTSDSKEYTASIRHKDFEETLSDGTIIKGGYFTTKDLSTGVISKEEAEFLNSEYIPLDGVYAMGTTPSNKLNVYNYDGDYTNLFPKTINLSGNWLTELDVTFKGNGVVEFVVMEYDLNGDGEFSSDEKLVLSTVDKEVDWSGFGIQQVNDIWLDSVEERMNWDDAKNYCSLHSAKLPTIKELENEVIKCGGNLNNTDENRENSVYQACIQNNGFDTSSYWSNDFYENSAYILDFDGGFSEPNRKELGRLVRCIKIKDQISTSTLKRTGQTKSYDESGSVVTDGSIKDDGYYQKGVTPSYTRDNTKEIVTDNITYLQWQDNEDAKTLEKPWVTQANLDVGNYNNTSGDTATTYCESLTLEGYNDWRLPTRKELFGIVDFGRYNPSIDLDKFKNVSSNDYWSATTLARSSSTAWFVNFDGGYVHYNLKNYNYYVRCVRTMTEEER